MYDLITNSGQEDFSHMSASPPLRIGLDLRYLQQALRNAPVGGIGGGIGGIGIVSRNLWRGLSALAEAETTPDFRLLALIDHGPVTENLRQMIGTAETIPFGLIGRSALATRFARSSYSWIVSALETRLGASALSGRVDIIHTLDQRPPIKGVATSVVTVHDRGVPSANPIMRALSEPWPGIARADAVAYVSAATRLDLADRLDARVGSPVIHRVIPTGIDLGQLRPLDLPAADIAARTGRLRPYFLHVGNCIGRKNPAGLLEAFRRSVVEACVDADLVMVGPYHVAVAGAVELRRLATAHGLADRLVVLDAIDQDQLTLLYNGAIALVFPSLFEGFGLPIIEALACGTVPIVSDRSSLPEAAGPHGVLVDPTDPRDIARAMIDLARHPRKASPEGVAWAHRFSISRMARDYLALYRDVVVSSTRERS
jgi:glycosyltransferase involved in cell wall biosynthesis